MIWQTFLCNLQISSVSWQIPESFPGQVSPVGLHCLWQDPPAKIILHIKDKIFFKILTFLVHILCRFSFLSCPLFCLLLFLFFLLLILFFVFFLSIFPPFPLFSPETCCCCPRDQHARKCFLLFYHFNKVEAVKHKKFHLFASRLRCPKTEKYLIQLEMKLQIF